MPLLFWGHPALMQFSCRPNMDLRLQTFKNLFLLLQYTQTNSLKNNIYIHLKKNTFILQECWKTFKIFEWDQHFYFRTSCEISIFLLWKTSNG